MTRMDSIDWALGVLELGPDATANEIKRAYRDLTKVWHPDRFSNDPRLREKADEKLKEIIEAYKLLTGSHAARRVRECAPRTAAPPPTAGNARGQATRPTPPPARSPDAQPERSKPSSVRAWQAAIGAIAVVGIIGYFVAQPTERPAVSAPTLPTSPNGETRLPVDTADPTSSIELSQQAGPATPTPATLPEFVRPNPLRELRLEDGLGSTDLYLSLLSRAERDAIESACRHARLAQGPAAYNQCVTDQLATLDR